MVVTIALAISLVEAYWMLPAHILGADVSFKQPSRIQIHRSNVMHWIRVKYTKILIKAMRWPKTILITVFFTFAAAFWVTMNGYVKIDFFASDPLRIFYENV